MKFKILFSLFGGAYISVFALSFLPVTLNLSPSVPMGLYWMTQDPSAPYMQFCMTPDEKQMAESHGLVSPPGNCPDKTEWIIKPSMQGIHDLVYDEQGVAVDGKLLPNTEPITKDRQGHPIKHYPFGHYRTTPTETWAVSWYCKRSFDSRYFGPIQRKDIVSYAKPILTLP